MSAFAQKVKRFYDLGLYTAQMVYAFYQKGKITAAEYNEIGGGEENG